jgi:hypothetical protein
MRVNQVAETTKITLTGVARERVNAESKTGKVWTLIKDGMTVKQFADAFSKTPYAKKEGPTGFLAYFVREGNIELKGFQYTPRNADSAKAQRFAERTGKAAKAAPAAKAAAPKAAKGKAPAAKAKAPAAKAAAPKAKASAKATELKAKIAAKKAA